MNKADRLLLTLGMAIATLLPFCAHAQDIYEPDNMPWQARIWQPGQTSPPFRTIHSPDDVDWIKVFLIRNEEFRFRGLQAGPLSDIQMEIFFKVPDGPFIQLGNAVNDHATGGGSAEEADMNIGSIFGGPPQGFYYIRVTSANTNFAFGTNSYYRFRTLSPTLDGGPNGGGGSGGGSGRPIAREEHETRGPGDPGYLIVVANDRMITNGYPEGARVIIDGVTDEPFTNQNMYFELSPGTYTVTVTTTNGYYPVEDPDYADQVSNPTNEFYGNPKHRVVVHDGWDMAVFLHCPYGRLDGELRDQFTGGFINDAAITLTPESGLLTNDSITFTAFQDNRAYFTNWGSQANGTLPSDVRVPPTNWHLTLSAEGYETNYTPGAISNLTLDENRDLGTIYLAPVDTDADGMSDAWETNTWGDLSQGPTTDFDGDGKSNKDEYLDGTDAANSNSFFGMLPHDLDNFELSWAATPGRQYEVCGTENISGQTWSNLSGTLSIGPDQTNLTWSGTNYMNTTSMHFYIQRVIP